MLVAHQLSAIGRRLHRLPAAPGRVLLLSGLLIAAVVSLRPEGAIAGGGCHEPSVTAAGTTLIALRQACFTPAIVQVAPGATVIWVNQDAGLPHTVTGASLQWGTQAPLGDRGSVAFRFPVAGTYPYNCTLHPGMVGVVLVGDAVAGANPPPIAVDLLAGVRALIQRLSHMVAGN